MSTKEKTGTQFDLEQWSQTRPQTFDHEAAYEERIRPILEALMNECAAVGIPALITMAYQQDGTLTGYETRSHFPSMERTPPGLLFALMATRNDQRSMDAVLAANAVRVCMTAITRH